MRSSVLAKLSALAASLFCVFLCAGRACWAPAPHAHPSALGPGSARPPECPPSSALVLYLPQFDVLWPQLSVREHLELWAAIKGFPRWAPGGAHSSDWCPAA